MTETHVTDDLLQKCIFAKKNITIFATQTLPSKTVEMMIFILSTLIYDHRNMHTPCTNSFL